MQFSINVNENVVHDLPKKTKQKKTKKKTIKMALPLKAYF